jgi:ABC-2 type transport system permease protein
VLRRFRATPLRPLAYIVGDVLVYFAMTVLGVLLLFLLGTTVYRVRSDGNLLAFAAGMCLSTAAFLALGYVLAGLTRSARAATVIGNVLLYLMVYLSGATVPLEVMPAAVRSATRFIPLTYVVALLRGLWFGEALGEHFTEIAVLGQMGNDAPVARLDLLRFRCRGEVGQGVLDVALCSSGIAGSLAGS